MTRYRLGTLGLELTMIAVTALFAFPLYVLVNIAVRRPNDPASPARPTTSPTLDNFADAWRMAGLAGAIGNSLIVTVLSVLIVVVVSSMAAYTLARVGAGWSRAVFLL